MASPTFQSTFFQFCEDLQGTFPELKAAIDGLKGWKEEDVMAGFRALWKSRLGQIAARDASVFSTSCEILPGVVIPSNLWKEVGDLTHTAIWNYLSSLALLSAANESDEDGFWNEEDFTKGMEEMMRQLKEAATGAAGGAGAAGFPFGGVGAMGGIFDKLRDMAKMFEGKDGKDGKGDGNDGPKMPDFKIPERIFKGHIAKMARELAEEFKPEDFGISPEMLNVNDPAKIFEYLQEIFTKNPDQLMSAAQRIAKKIQAKFQRGEIRREEIIQEIEELMKEFSGNEAFSSIFGQMGDILQMSGKSTGNEGSERLRAAKDRLRKKQAEKDAKKQGSQSTHITLASNAAADAMAAALLAEEDAKKKSGKRK